MKVANRKETFRLYLYEYKGYQGRIFLAGTGRFLPSDGEIAKALTSKEADPQKELILYGRKAGVKEYGPIKGRAWLVSYGAEQDRGPIRSGQRLSSLPQRHLLPRLEGVCGREGNAYLSGKPCIQGPRSPEGEARCGIRVYPPLLLPGPPAHPGRHRPVRGAAYERQISVSHQTRTAAWCEPGLPLYTSSRWCFITRPSTMNMTSSPIFVDRSAMRSRLREMLRRWKPRSMVEGSAVM